jgi:homoserine O-succinyltransferase
MAIILPTDLPAARRLRAEGVDVLAPNEDRAVGSALRIAVLNLMPNKPDTETQICRVLAESAYRVTPRFFVPDSYQSKTTPAQHIDAFYARWSQIREHEIDGLLVTGAPVETLAFEDVTYWHELRAIFDWARERIGESFYICWAAQAALQHFHGVPKHELPEKMFGVFPHRLVRPDAPLLRGMEDGFPIPVSRHTAVRADDLPGGRGIEVLAASAESGLGLVRDRQNRAVYMFNHLEYDADTLSREYFRDLREGRPVPLPRHYFPDDDPARCPAQTWRGSARILFRNWLDQVWHHRAGRNDSRQAMDWLFGAPGPVAVGACLTDMRLDVEEPLTAVPAVLRSLAAAGHAPTALKASKNGAADCTVTMRVNGVGGPAAEILLRHIFETVPGARRATFRDSQGFGGLVVASPGTRSRIEGPAACAADSAA